MGLEEIVNMPGGRLAPRRFAQRGLGSTGASDAVADAPSPANEEDHMPSLKDLTAVTSRLNQLAGELHSELAEGSIDFRKMVELADDIGASSDRLAAAFNTMADALDTSLDESGADEHAEGDGEGEQNRE